LQKEVEDVNESAKQKAPMLERIEKHSIECPNYFVTTLQFEKQIKHEEGEEEVAKKQDRSKQKHQKSKGQYTNWFQPHIWPPIIVSIQKYDANSNAMHYLQTTYQSPRIPSPYKKLAKNSLWTCFTPKIEI
jgi:hypothetical protein